jgi:hypothetical protein
VYGSLLARVRYSSSASPSSDSWEGMKLPFLYGAADWPQVFFGDRNAGILDQNVVDSGWSAADMG